MPDPSIEGFAVISGSRIILPVELATIDATVVLPSIATIGTILTGNVTASISGSTIMVGTVGAIGTILSPVPVVVGSISAATVASGTVSATIKSGPGVFYGAVITSEAGSGTLIVFGGGIALANVIARIIGAATTTAQVQTGVKGIAFTTLIASVLGTLEYSVYYE